MNREPGMEIGYHSAVRCYSLCSPSVLRVEGVRLLNVPVGWVAANLPLRAVPVARNARKMVETPNDT